MDENNYQSVLSVLSVCAIRPGAEFVSVTRHNVRTAAGTVVIGDMSKPEALFPIREARRLGRPLLILEWNRHDRVPDSKKLRDWVSA